MYISLSRSASVSLPTEIESTVWFPAQYATAITPRSVDVDDPCDARQRGHDAERQNDNFILDVMVDLIDYSRNGILHVPSR